MSDTREPHDGKTYNMFFHVDTLRFFHTALKHYDELIKSGVAKVAADPDLSLLLPNASQLMTEHGSLYILSWTIEKFERLLSGQPKDWETRTVSLNHEIVRFLKSVAQLYISYLAARRDVIAAKSFPGFLLEQIDARLTSYREKLTMGVFRDATPLPLLYIEDLQAGTLESIEQNAQLPVSPKSQRPVVAASIQIFDVELRSRCLDLFNNFSESGAHDRLDTCISEATKILEVRIRTIAGLPQELVGVSLASSAFCGDNPPLRLSDQKSEQEGACAMFRGAFGFLRNPAAHKLLGSLNPDRVLQILGWIDHLLHLVESAQHTSPMEQRPGTQSP